MKCIRELSVRFVRTESTVLCIMEWYTSRSFLVAKIDS